jgi:hypothetical protein
MNPHPDYFARLVDGTGVMIDVRAAGEPVTGDGQTGYRMMVLSFSGAVHRAAVALAEVGQRVWGLRGMSSSTSGARHGSLVRVG